MLSTMFRLNAHSFYINAHFLYLLMLTMQHKRKTMLETIYEDDENILSESENDSAKSIEQ